MTSKLPLALCWLGIGLGVGEGALPQRHRDTETDTERKERGGRGEGEDRIDPTLGHGIGIGVGIGFGVGFGNGFGNGDDRQLEPEELTKRRESLATWTIEPVAIEGQDFLFHLDRRDGSFFFQDRRTGVKWYSPWGRRGFASVRLAGQERWIPVDRVEGLSSEETKIRFRGASSAGAIPAIRFAIEAIAGSRGVSISFEVTEEDRSRVAAVRLFDGALWIADAEKGGVALPAGMGEWHAADVSGNFRRRLEAFGPAAVKGSEPYTLSCVPLLKSENPILLSWSDATAAVELERRLVPGDTFPGTGGLFVTLDFVAASGKADVITLGKEQAGVIDAARAHREVLGQGGHVVTLRSKTGQRPELRALLGAALFRVPVGATRTFADVAKLADRFKRVLDIEEAAFILTGWATPAPGAAPVGAPPSVLLPAAAEAGGDAGLKSCAAAVKGLGYIFGLEAEAQRFASGRKEGADSASLFWKDAFEVARREENCPALEELCTPELLVLKESGPWPAASRPADALGTRADFLRYLRDTFGLAGVSPGSGAEVEYAAYFDGLLSNALRNPASPEAWPLFSAAFGHCVRIACEAKDAVRPDDPVSVLVHLLAGELPLYALPGEMRAPPGAAPAPYPDDPRFCFARDEGWAAGKGFSPHEIFLKNTYEVLSRVTRQRCRDPLFYHRKLNAAGTAQETYFGTDLRVVVNFGPGNYEDEEEGFLLPPLGFFVRHPFFRAFHALRMNDVTYERPAFFEMHSLEGKMILRADAVKVYHGFGPDTFQFGGRTFQVEREAVVKFQ